MARKITFDIITTAQTQQLHELNELMKDIKKTADSLTRGQRKTLDKALNLSGVEGDAEGARTAVKDLSEALVTLNRETTEAATKRQKLTQEQKEAAAAARKLAAEERKTAKEQERAQAAAQKQADAEEKRLQAIRDAEAATKKMSGTTKDYQKDMQGLRKTILEQESAFGDLDKRMSQHLSRGYREGSRDVETFRSDLRQLTPEIGRVDKAMQGMKTFPEEYAAANRKYIDAMKDASEAQSKLMRVQNAPNKSIDDIRDAQQAYDKSVRSYKEAEAAVTALNTRYETMGKTVNDAERRVAKLQNTMSKPGMEELVSAADINKMEALKDSLVSVGRAMDKYVGPSVESFDKLSKSMGALKGRQTQLKSLSETISDLHRELTGIDKFNMSELLKDIGNPRAAIAATTNAIRQQANEMNALAASTSKIISSNAKWVAAEDAKNAALAQGRKALEQQKRIEQMYAGSVSDAKSARSSLESRNLQLLSQENELLQRRQQLLQQIAATRTLRDTASSRDTQQYVEATTKLKQLSEALDQNRTAQRMNQENIRNGANAYRDATQAVDRLENSYGQMRAEFVALRNASNTNMFASMLQGIQKLNRVIMTLSASFSSRLRSAITTAANAARGFVNSAGTMFSGLQRALQSLSTSFSNFGQRVAHSMDQARAATMEFYAAGYSLLTMGSQLQQFGTQLFRGMGQGLEGFMAYERARTQAGIAGAQPVDAQGNVIPAGASTPVAGYQVNSKIIDDIIFDLQRGTATPEWLKGDSGGRLPVAFDAKELAKGLYYYSSAIGAPITQTNQREVSDAVATIMQMAKITDTGVETATKGVLNVMMEFGYDPRAIGSENQSVRQQSAKDTALVASQLGYLANISSMEVSDIVETFKMVGPQAHFLSPGGLGNQPGAGLLETFALTYLASEVGLRGGNVGRGVNQAFTSLLDPTDKMLEIAGKYWGDAGEKLTKDQFNDIFKDSAGALKGGITGFLMTLSEVPRELQSQMLAELFTSNATRALMGPVLASGGFDIDKWTEFLEGMKENPFKWMAAAAAETANTVSGWFTFMQNGWFQFQSAVIGSVSGPLMGAFRLIGEVLFEIAERMKLDPNIGRVIASIITAVAALATVLGTLMIGAGAILLVGRSFAMLGGMVLPVLRIFLMAGATIFGLIPILGLVAVAVGLLAAAFKSNMFGMQDAWGSVKNAFENFDTVIVPAIDRVMSGLGNLGRAFNQFVNGILLGTGPLGNLRDVLQRVFGEELGGAFMNSLLHLREALGPLRQQVADFLSAKTFDVSALKNAGAVIQGLLEQIFLGHMSGRNMAKISNLGTALGIDDLIGKLRTAGSAISWFAGTAVAYGQAIANVWLGMAQQIHANLAQVLGGNMTALFQNLGTVALGVANGISAAFTILLGAVVKLTGYLARLATTLRNAGSAGVQILGFTVTFNGALTALGTTIGLVLGTRLALAFGPFMGVISRVLPMVSSLASVIVGVGGQFLVMAANVAISTAAWLANTAVMAANAATQFVLAGAGMALGGVQATLAGESSLLGTIWTLLSGLSTILAASWANLTFTAGLLAAGEITAATAGAFLEAVLVSLAAVAAIAVIGFGLLAAILSGVAVVMLGMVLATQGVGAAFQAAVSLVQGFWAGLQFGISIIVQFSSVVMGLISAIGNLVGVGNDFRALGYAIGLSISLMIAAAVALIAILAVLAVQMAVTWLTGLGPIGLIVLAIAGIGIALYALVKNFDEVKAAASEFWDGLQQAGQNAADGLKLAFLSTIDAITGAFASGIKGLFDQVKKVDDIIPGGDMFGYGGINDLGGTNLAEGVRKDIRNRALDNAWLNAEASMWDDSIQQATDAGTASGEGFVGGLQGVLASVGLDDDFSNLMSQMGLDPEHMGIEDISTAFTELFKMPENLAAGTDIDWSFLGPRGTEYGKALSAWDEYQALIKYNMDTYGWSLEKATAATDLYFAETGRNIPSEPFMADYLGEEAEGAQSAADLLAKAAADIGLSMDNIREAFGSLKGMSLEDFMNAQSPTGTSVGGLLAGKVGETILGNIPEGTAPWMNQTELVFDAAGSGANLTASPGGRNMHRVMAPYLDIVADQTGVSVDQLLVDVPKFVAPPEFVGLAQADIALGISEGLTRGEYLALDLLGADANVKGYEAGMDWAELTDYAVGQAVAGHEWNLTDFLAESWGWTVDQANDYLREHNIDPNAISSGMMEATEIATMTGNGAFDVMTQDMYDYLADATNDFTSKTITMTASEWAKIPPAYKAVMKSLGITTIIADEFITPEAYKAAEDQVKKFGELAQSLPTYIAEGMEGIANYQMEGDPRSWLKVDEFEDASGQLMVTLQDLDGTQIHIPAAEYDAYMESIEKIKSLTKAAKQQFENAELAMKVSLKLQASGDTFGGLGAMAAGGGFGALGGVLQGGATKENQINQSLGLPDHVEVGVNLKINAESVQKDIQAAIGGPSAGAAGEAVEIKVKVTPNMDDFTKILGGMGTAYGTTPNFKIKLTPDIAHFAETISSMGSSYAATSQFKIKVTPDLSYFAESLNTMRGSYGSSDGFKVKITPDLVEFGQTIANLGANWSALRIPVDADTSLFGQTVALLPLAWAGVPLKIDVDANTTPFTTTVAMLPLMWAGTPLKIQVDADTTTATTNIETATKAAQEFATSWTAVILESGAATVASSIGNALGIAKLFAVTWTATIAETGAGSAKSAIDSAKASADALVGTYTATVVINVSGLDALQSAINLLNALDGRNVSSVATITTNNVTNNITNAVNRVSNGATGGRIGSAAMLGRAHDPRAIVGRAVGGYVAAGEYTLVGELGPELVKLPTGSYVHTARETDRMLTQSLSNTAYIGGESKQGDITINNPQVTSGDTYNFYGDIRIEDKQAAEAWFEEMDRRTGKKNQLARRGMLPVDDYRPW